ncbi:hypothetical protein [Herpetosiphon llansteffanensis]|uniref:hypothetical protein n=1 Tax=Herpetosiphon llansteffanensis TaxID=2094568 RepID=UPI000D7C1490|nr:hypothetical protein [Herpetosiphon llansteffanensis]
MEELNRELDLQPSLGELIDECFKYGIGLGVVVGGIYGFTLGLFADFAVALVAAVIGVVYGAAMGLIGSPIVAIIIRNWRKRFGSTLISNFGLWLLTPICLSSLHSLSWYPFFAANYSIKAYFAAFLGSGSNLSFLHLSIVYPNWLLVLFMVLAFPAVLGRLDEL